MTEQKRLSTTLLAKKRGIAQSQLFSELSGLGLIIKESDKWILTSAGEQLGGVHLTGKYGQYVAWPEDIVFDKPAIEPTKPIEPVKAKLITATAIGQAFELSSKKMNYILSELGWIKRGLKGWLVTEQGLKLGAVQGEDSRSGIPYARWPESILNAKALKDSIDNLKGIEKPKTEADKADGFRHKF